MCFYIEQPFQDSGLLATEHSSHGATCALTGRILEETWLRALGSKNSLNALSPSNP